jgi:hypothetical protein
MTGALGVGVRELVHEDDRGAPRERSVQVELGERGPAIGDEARGQHRQPFQQGRRLRPAMRLHDADEHFHAVGAQRARGLQHGEGLADPRGGAEEEL